MNGWLLGWSTPFDSHGFAREMLDLRITGIRRMGRQLVELGIRVKPLCSESKQLPFVEVLDPNSQIIRIIAPVLIYSIFSDYVETFV